MTECLDRVCQSIITGSARSPVQLPPEDWFYGDGTGSLSHYVMILFLIIFCLLAFATLCVGIIEGSIIIIHKVKARRELAKLREGIIYGNR